MTLKWCKIYFFKFASLSFFKFLVSTLSIILKVYVVAYKDADIVFKISSLVHP